MSIINKLSSNSVIHITLEENKKSVDFMEGCDYYYRIQLNKSEMKQFIIELLALEKQMTED